VLDTNVLMHDPTALFRFQEHDVFLPMDVLEELDNSKVGMTEVARNVRQVNRFLDELITQSGVADITAGVPLSNRITNGQGDVSGTLFIQTHTLNADLPEGMPGNKKDNSILSTALALRNERPDVTVTLVTKDINLRIKATVLGVHVEDYFNDQVLEDVNLLYKGSAELPDDFWDTHGDNMESWQEDGHTFYRVRGPLAEQWHPNQCLSVEGSR